MGACQVFERSAPRGTPAERAADAAIARAQLAQRRREEGRIKLLLLGAGDSGKSTFCKQVRELYGTGMTRADRLLERPRVVDNLLEVLGEPQGQDALSPAHVARLRTLAAEHAEHLTALPAGAQYFLQHLDRVAAPDYEPTLEDLLHVRVRTSGIYTLDFEIQNQPFVLYDVGGQKNERRKWISAFDDVMMVLFVASVAEFDLHMQEDDAVLRMDDAIALFDSVAHSPHFARTPMALFLNKTDLLPAALRRSAFRVPGVRYDDYAGPELTANGVNEAEVVAAVLGYLRGRFLACVRDVGRSVFVHYTSAVDTGNVRNVFEDCRAVVVRRGLVSAGFED